MVVSLLYRFQLLAGVLGMGVTLNRGVNNMQRRILRSEMLIFTKLETA